jgi:hypothetical protein
MASRTHSGGGRTPTMQRPRTGRAAEGINPQHAAQIGRSMTIKDQRAAPVPAGGKVPLGNEVALNVGRGGPGMGRTVHHCGSQGTHGPVASGSSPPARDILSAFGAELSGRGRR